MSSLGLTGIQKGLHRLIDIHWYTKWLTETYLGNWNSKRVTEGQLGSEEFIGVHLNTRALSTPFLMKTMVQNCECLRTMKETIYLDKKEFTEAHFDTLELTETPKVL